MVSAIRKVQYLTLHPSKDKETQTVHKLCDVDSEALKLLNEYIPWYNISEVSYNLIFYYKVSIREKKELICLPTK